MSASQNNHRNPSRRNDGPAASNGTGPSDADGAAVRAVEPGPGTAETSDQAATGALRVLPAPFAEKALTAASVARGSGGAMWTVVRSHKTATGAAAMGTTAAVAGAYALGRRAGRRRRRGPLTLLLGGRA